MPTMRSKSGNKSKDEKVYGEKGSDRRIMKMKSRRKNSAQRRMHR